MSSSRLLDLWTPPAGYRLASLMATTYQLQADFIEDDLLPVALGLRQSSSKGRGFRIELESALQNVDVTIYLHPDGYAPGLRRSPRIDLVPVTENRLPKLHAKVALLVFVPEQGNDVAEQVVRLITGSANLTVNGYRHNIELAVAMDDAPGAAAVTATAVRSAADWLWRTLPPDTDQAKAQHRFMQAAFDARPVSPIGDGMEFVGLPREGGLIPALSALDVGNVHTVTVVSPFWPTGEDASDVASGLMRACRGIPKQVRLVGPCRAVEERLYPEMPPALLQALKARGVSRLEVAYARPGFGCQPKSDEPADDEGEYDSLNAGRTDTFTAWRPLHAKALLIEGSRGCVLAMGSFNFTRRGLGLHGRVSNTEAGVIWRVAGNAAESLRQAIGFHGPWIEVDQSKDGLVVAPGPMDGNEGQQWPAFIRAIRANRNALLIEGDGAIWPSRLKVSMRDIRSRLAELERCFDPWVIERPAKGGDIHRELAMVAGWIQEEGQQVLSRYPALPDLEVLLEWDGQSAVLPVVFVDKHEFPVLEQTVPEDERMLLDWFLGLRPTDGTDGGGYGHSVDPRTETTASQPGEDAGILSYLVRDFVHALPGIRAHLEECAVTETALRTALLGPRSPARLAGEILEARKKNVRGMPRKTGVATTFQLIELRKLVEQVPLPTLPDGATGKLRSQCLSRIDDALAVAVGELQQPLEPVLERYLRMREEGRHASA